ncbi:MAG TPA: AsmA family protein [Alphaproteobacteria bacterium]|nr:AsmA family protein [Alphaproteobacteria bacterium]
MRTVRKFKRPPSRGRKIAYSLAASVLLLLIAALLLPGFIDWNRFKDQIESQASTFAGRQVRINGPISFSMLPRPALSLENATLANHADASEPVMLSLERLDAQLAMAALLSGKIQVANFRLIAPILNLETLPDGVNNWDILAAGATPPAEIKFDHVLIERGQMRYRNRVSGAALSASEMDLQLSGESLFGPFKLAGAMRLQDVPLRLEAKAGKFSGGQPAALILKSMLPENTRLDFNGTVTSHGDMAGTLVGQGADLNLLMTHMVKLGVPALAGMQAGFLPYAYQLEGVLSVTPGRFDFDKVKFSLNENALTASLKIDMTAAPVFEAVVNASSLDLDKLRNDTAPDAPFLTLPAGFEIRPDLKGTVRITGNAVKLNNGTVRDIAIAANVSNGALTLENFSAYLPGSTALKISGELTHSGGAPNFKGNLDVRAEYFRALLGWLGMQTPDIPDRSLGRAELTAQIDITPELAQLHKITAAIDASKLTGDLALALRGRPALGIELKIDQLNADNYFPEAGAAPVADPAANIAAPAAPKWPIIRQLIMQHDSNFDLSVNELTYRGLPITKLQAEGSLVSGTVAFNKFTIADISGSAFSLSGILSNFSSVMQGEINLRLASNDLGGLARTLGTPLPIPGAQLGKTRIEAKFLLADTGVEAAINSQFGETSLEIAGSFNGLAPGIIAPAGEPAASRMRIALNSPSLHGIAAQAGYKISPAEAGDDAGLSLTAELASANNEISLSALNGVIGAIPIQGQASWNAAGPKPVFRAEAHAGEILMDNLFQTAPSPDAARSSQNRQLPWSGAPLDLTFMDRFEADIILDAARISAAGYDIVKPSVTLELRAGRASLKQLTGQLFGGEAVLSASLSNVQNMPEFTAGWNLKDVDIQAVSLAVAGSPAMTGQLDFSGSVKGAGASSFALVSSLEGKAQLTASKGFIQGINLPAFSAQLAKLERAADFQKLAAPALQDGATPYTRISAPFTIAQGVAQSDKPEISIATATGGLEASIDLPRYWLTAEANLTLNDHMSAPPLGIAFIGPLNAPERSLRTSRIENHFTQALMSKSLQRIISDRDAAPAPIPVTGAPPVAEQTPPPSEPPVSAQQPSAPAPSVAPQESTARKMLNSIIDGLIKEPSR